MNQSSLLLFRKQQKSIWEKEKMMRAKTDVEEDSATEEAEDIKLTEALVAEDSAEATKINKLMRKRVVPLLSRNEQNIIFNEN
jgi:hypothetical protein